MRDVTLYSYWRSSCSWRVRTALHLKGVSFETIPVHLVRDGGEQRKEGFLRKHAIGQVPVVEWRDEQGASCRLGQSMAIVTLLEATFPKPALLPRDAYGRARVLAAAELVNSGIQPLQNLTVLRQIEQQGGDKTAWASTWIERGLRALEEQLQGEPGPFLFGDAPTIADIFVVPQLYNARRFDLSLDAYPRLLEAEKACEALPAFQAAHPSVQPDAPTE